MVTSNVKIVRRVIGITSLVESIALIVCIPIALIYHEPIFPFLISSALAVTLAAVLLVLPGAKVTLISDKVDVRQGVLSVTLSWVTLSLIGSMPYIFSHSMEGFIDPIFESISGFTTTGSSILKDIEVLPYSILFWRSLTHWIGGIGIIVLVIIILPGMNIGSHRLFILESSLRDKTHPKTKSVGLRLLYIYIGLTILLIFFLLLGKMNLFESVCHAFGTIATGGFSPKNNSIAGYSSYIHYVIMIFMFASGINFVLYYYLLKRDINRVRRNEELRLYILIVLSSGALVTLLLFINGGLPLEIAIRDAFFQVISIISSTGFATADYLLWPSAGIIVIFLLMFSGGCMGSTSGGIKVGRHLLQLKTMKENFQIMLHPSAVTCLKINGNPINQKHRQMVLSFILLYFFVFVIGTVLMTLFGSDIQTSAGAVATTMGGIGPGLGIVGPVSNFAALPDLSKVLLSILMIVGRLEIYTVLLIFTRGIWK